MKSSKLWSKPRAGFAAIFTDPEELEAQARAYFNFCDTTPWFRAEPVKYEGYGNTMELPLGRPYTMDGFCVFVGVSQGYFNVRLMRLRALQDEGKATEQEIELIEVIDWIMTVVRTQQLEGAAVGVFKESLVARINGLAENIKQETNNTAAVRIEVRDQKTADQLNELDDLL